MDTELIGSEATAIERAFASFAEGNPKPFFDLLDDRVVVEFPESTGLPWSGRLEGKEAVASALSGIAGLGEYTVFELLEIFSKAGRHIVRMRETFRFHATGEELPLEQIFLYEFSGKKVIAIREWTDTARIRDAFLRAAP